MILDLQSSQSSKSETTILAEILRRKERLLPLVSATYWIDDEGRRADGRPASSERGEQRCFDDCPFWRLPW
jgi:hypothetical protein